MTWKAAVMHVTVSAMGIPASHLLLRNHACAHHGIFVEGQGLIMIDMVFQKRIDGVAVLPKLIRLKCANHHQNDNQG